MIKKKPNLVRHRISGLEEMGEIASIHNTLVPVETPGNKGSDHYYELK